MTYDAAIGPEQHLEVSLDVQRALETCAVKLQSEFADSFDAETVRRSVYVSYEKLAAHATIRDFLPLPAERFARQQLHARAKINSTSGREMLVVLFLCNHNAGRSQMALGYFNHFAGGGAVAWSGGSEPQGEINPAAVAVMAERGIDISGEFPKPWTGETVQAADVIVTMGCGEPGPAVAGRRYENWAFEDPAGKDLPDVRVIRDEIERRVLWLLDDLRIPIRP
ncbi:arsenate reductase ArsC [Mycobacterium cookii]|uniref:Putative arsenate reductase ArsC n=1 Tax=Mycobacterium cookii TaxID=1775 RepID=A0A7I7KUN0_9MYCO|nr:arsenate reductase ArsC [Mycobacterium cookii]MCV7328673.1 arsenate reductase ArsC [Mycobacterium cookii]BBX45291.1 putative arsenate reductase ArsC [Mycobacterium cookii]